MASSSKFPWDLLVDNCNGQPALVVEVKRKTNVSPTWAAEFRRNLFAHGAFPKAPYFLMVFPDKFYLWSHADVLSEQSEPDYIIDARPILKPYFARAGVTADQISGQSFELIITSWLGEIIYAEKLPKNVDDPQRWLIDSGLYAALTGGALKHEAAA
ncbi:hypothetical protein ACKFKF_07715 [Phormidesmis sp. 146-12]